MPVLPRASVGNGVSNTSRGSLVVSLIPLRRASSAMHVAIISRSVASGIRIMLRNVRVCNTLHRSTSLGSPNPPSFHAAEELCRHRLPPEEIL